MPNRILRDWTDSADANSLSWQAEVFFVRLIMKADDYGRFSANPKLLRSLLFPIRDGLREADISRWMAECQKAGLIRLYADGGKSFLFIVKFKQQQRSPSKYPEPPENCAADAQHVIANDYLGGPIVVEDEVVVVNGAGAQNGRTAKKLALTDTPGFSAFWAAYPRKQAKAEARLAWEQMKCEDKLPDILATIKQAVRSRDWQRDSGQFIPHPATWLRREGWSDVYGRPVIKAEPKPDPEGWRDWLAKWNRPYIAYALATPTARDAFQKGDLP